MKITVTTATITVEKRTVPLQAKHVAQFRRFDPKTQADLVGVVVLGIVLTKDGVVILFLVPDGDGFEPRRMSYSTYWNTGFEKHFGDTRNMPRIVLV